MAWQREAAQALAFLYRQVLGLEQGLAEVGRVREAPPTCPATQGDKKLLDRVREALRLWHYSLRTKECYVSWITRFILFHNKRHPAEMGGREIEEFLTDLAVRGHVSASTQTQALNALVFLYKQVLAIELPRLDAVRARRPRRLPVVMSRAEVRQVLEAIDGYGGLYPLMARLMYGTGMRLLECCGLRVKDVDWQRHQILVRQGKGDKDRVVMLPRALKAEMEKQLAVRLGQHEKDLARGIAHVPLPDALERKYPNAARELGWQFLFASRQLQERGTDIRTVQELLGRKDVSTTMMYPHVMEKGVARTASPLDFLDEVTPEELTAAVTASRMLQ